MRLPIAKVYRAFPELDRFSDAECEGFVRRARLEHRLQEGILALIGMASTLVMLTIGGTLVLRAMLFIRGAITRRNELSPVEITAYVFIVAIPSMIAPLCMRDWWLRRVIVKRLIRTACLNCSYSLLGLSVVDGVVTCPECGAKAVLKQRGMTPEDLIANVSHGGKRAPA